MFGFGKLSERKALRYLQKQGWGGKTLLDVAEDTHFSIWGSIFRSPLDFLLYHWENTPQHLKVVQFLTPDVQSLYRLNSDGRPLFWGSIPRHTLSFLKNKGVDLDYPSSKGETWLGYYLNIAVSVEHMFPETVESYQNALSLLVEHGASVWSEVEGRSLIDIAQGTQFQSILEQGILLDRARLSEHIPDLQEPDKTTPHSKSRL